MRVLSYVQSLKEEESRWSCESGTKSGCVDVVSKRKVFVVVRKRRAKSAIKKWLAESKVNAFPSRSVIGVRRSVKQTLWLSSWGRLLRKSGSDLSQVPTKPLERCQSHTSNTKRLPFSFARDRASAFDVISAASEKSPTTCDLRSAKAVGLFVLDAL